MDALYRTTNGELVSVGSVIASPLPTGMATVTLSAADAAGLADGSRKWDAATRTVVATPGWVSPTVAVTNRATIETSLAADMTLMQNIINSADASFTTVAAAQTAHRALQAQVRDIARNLRRLDRSILGDYSGST